MTRKCGTSVPRGLNPHFISTKKVFSLQDRSGTGITSLQIKLTQGTVRDARSVRTWEVILREPDWRLGAWWQEGYCWQWGWWYMPLCVFCFKFLEGNPAVGYWILGGTKFTNTEIWWSSPLGFCFRLVRAEIPNCQCSSTNISVRLARKQTVGSSKVFCLTIL